MCSQPCCCPTNYASTQSRLALDLTTWAFTSALELCILTACRRDLLWGSWTVKILRRAQKPAATPSRALPTEEPVFAKCEKKGSLGKVKSLQFHGPLVHTSLSRLLAGFSVCADELQPSSSRNHHVLHGLWPEAT